MRVFCVFESLYLSVLKNVTGQLTKYAPVCAWKFAILSSHFSPTLQSPSVVVINSPLASFIEESIARFFGEVLLVFGSS